MARDLEWDGDDASGNVEAIARIEELVGHRFPPAYKAVVEIYDGASVVSGDAFRFASSLTGRSEVYGLGQMIRLKSPSDRPNAATFEWYWKQRPARFPENVVPFAIEGGGDWICFDYGNAPNPTDPPVVVVHFRGTPGSGNEISKVAPNFLAFLEMLSEDE